MKRLTAYAFFLTLFLVLFFLTKEEGDSLFDRHNLPLLLILLLNGLGNIKKKVIAKAKMPFVQSVKSEKFKREFIGSATASTLGIFIGALLLFLSILLLLLDAMIPMILLLFLSFSFIVTAAIQYNHPAKLIFSHQGMEFRTSTINLKCNWEDISEIAGFWDGTEAIILSKATYKRNLWSILFFDRKLFPSAFDHQWKKGEIGKLIKQNATQLEYRES